MRDGRSVVAASLLVAVLAGGISPTPDCVADEMGAWAIFSLPPGAQERCSVYCAVSGGKRRLNYLKLKPGETQKWQCGPAGELEEAGKIHIHRK